MQIETEFGIGSRVWFVRWEEVTEICRECGRVKDNNEYRGYPEDTIVTFIAITIDSSGPCIRYTTKDCNGPLYSHEVFNFKHDAENAIANES